jgi:hypothetical protein
MPKGHSVWDRVSLDQLAWAIEDRRKRVHPQRFGAVTSRFEAHGNLRLLVRSDDASHQVSEEQRPDLCSSLVCDEWEFALLGRDSRGGRHCRSPDEIEKGFQMWAEPTNSLGSLRLVNLLPMHFHIHSEHLTFKFNSSTTEGFYRKRARNDAQAQQILGKCRSSAWVRACRYCGVR